MKSSKTFERLNASHGLRAMPCSFKPTGYSRQRMFFFSQAALHGVVNFFSLSSVRVQPLFILKEGVTDGNFKGTNQF